MTRQLQLFPRVRPAPQRRMHVIDAGNAPDGSMIASFACPRCQHDAGWWRVTSKSDAQRRAPTMPALRDAAGRRMTRPTRYPVLVRLGQPGAIGALYLQAPSSWRLAWSGNRSRATRFYSPEEVAWVRAALPAGTTIHTEEDTPDVA